MMPDIQFYLSLFFRRLHYFLILTALGSAVGITLALLLPPRYVAQARLVVESEQIPDELAASTVRTEAREQLQIIQQRILTRDNLLEMANRLNIYRPVPGQPDRDLRPDEKVADLRRRIDISTSNRRGDATIVNVGFEAGVPALAASVTNEVVTLILEENVRMRTGVSGQTLEFFEREADRLDRELARRGAEIVAFKNANREALPDSLGFRRGRLEEAQAKLIQIGRDEVALKDRRQNLVALYEATGQIAGSTEALSPAARELRQLREEYARRIAVLSPENPRIKVLNSRIENMQAIVDKEASEELTIAGLSRDGQPLTAYEIQLADLDGQIEVVAQLRAQLETAMEQLQATIDATPENSITIQTLERDYANIQAQYNKAVSNRARAETGDMIEALSKGERISVIEQAVAPREPNSPDRPKLVTAGVGGGMMMGLGLIVLLELLNTAIRRPVDIVSKLDITPFATLSFIRTRRDVIRRRAMIGAAFAIVLAGIPVGLWAVDTYYRPLDLLFESVLKKIPVLAALPQAAVPEPPRG